MARALEELGVVAVLRGSDPGRVADAARALGAGGVTAVEVTYTVPGATDVIARLASEGGLVVGAGTVTTRRQADEAIAAGAGALLGASGCPPGHSPSHRGLDPVWARAQEAGLPVVFHVGGTGDLIDGNYFRNGLPIPPDFHGGEENFRSVDYMGIPGPPAQTLATMIFDGVLERFGDLRVGVIEQGAVWVPSWLRQMESAYDAFHRHEERLQGLSLRPTEYVRRQVRVTPYPTEDVGWIIANSGPEVCLFSSDYPHVEGGRRPIERFERSMTAAGTGDAARHAFYHDNFVDLMGTGLPAAACQMGPRPI
jgi:predicted TIM-barrel fold metal-dependent hydrolase